MFLEQLSLVSFHQSYFDFAQLTKLRANRWVATSALLISKRVLRKAEGRCFAPFLCQFGRLRNSKSAFPLSIFETINELNSIYTDRLSVMYVVYQSLGLLVYVSNAS